MTSWTVRGGGLAGWAAAVMLVEALPADDRVELVEDDAPDHPLLDIITLGAESALLAASGLEAGDLLVQTDGGFHLGTALECWSGPRRAWVCESEALPLYEGVAVHDLVLAMAAGEDRAADYAGFFAPLQFQARMADAGRYAEPAADRASPRSLLRPGIVVDSARLRDRLRERALSLGVERTAGAENPRLVVDTRSPAPDWCDEGERFGFDQIVSGWRADDGPRAPHLTARPLSNGLAVEAPLAGGVRVVAAVAGEWVDDALSDAAEAPARPGWSRTPWRGDTVAIGPASACLGPLFGQDAALLDAQLTMLAELLPGSDGTAACAAEFNRRHVQQTGHRADLIQLAMRRCARAEPFWAARRSSPPSDALTRRLQQFQLRNRSVAMDGDPFDAPLWLSTCIALGYVPRRGDPRADALDPRRAAAHLGRIVQAFDATLAALPTHDAALAKLAEAPADYEWPTEFANL